MRLSAYLEADEAANGRGAVTRFATMLKTSKGFISDIASGKRECSMAFARVIRIATKGLVTETEISEQRAEWLAANAQTADQQPPAAA